MTTVNEFVNGYGITLSNVEKTRTSLEKSGYGQYVRFHWRVTISYNGRHYTTPYHHGMASFSYKMKGEEKAELNRVEKIMAGRSNDDQIALRFYQDNNFARVFKQHFDTTDILLSLLVDCQSYENAPNEPDFLAEYGYTEGGNVGYGRPEPDPGSLLNEGRKAYAGCKQAAEAMRQMFGHQLYADFLELTEEE